MDHRISLKNIVPTRPSLEASSSKQGETAKQLWITQRRTTTQLKDWKNKTHQGQIQTGRYWRNPQYASHDSINFYYSDEDTSESSMTKNDNNDSKPIADSDINLYRRRHGKEIPSSSDSEASFEGHQHNSPGYA